MLFISGFLCRLSFPLNNEPYEWQAFFKTIKRNGDDFMYEIKLNGEFTLLNAEGTAPERFDTFEQAVEAESLYPDFETEIISL